MGPDVVDSIQEHDPPVLISRIFAICNCSGKSNQFVPIKVKVWASTPSHPSRMVRYPFIELSLIHQDPLYPHPQLPGAPSPLQIKHCRHYRHLATYDGRKMFRKTWKWFTWETFLIFQNLPEKSRKNGLSKIWITTILLALYFFDNY